MTLMPMLFSDEEFEILRRHCQEIAKTRPGWSEKTDFVRTWQARLGTIAFYLAVEDNKNKSNENKHLIEAIEVVSKFILDNADSPLGVRLLEQMNSMLE